MNFVTGAVLTVVKLFWCVHRPTHSGLPTVANSEWCAHCGQYILVCRLWPKRFGEPTVAKPYWCAHCALYIMACTLWPKHIGVQTVAKHVGVPTVVKAYW